MVVSAVSDLRSSRSIAVTFIVYADFLCVACASRFARWRVVHALSASLSCRWLFSWPCRCRCCSIGRCSILAITLLLFPLSSALISCRTFGTASRGFGVRLTHLESVHACEERCRHTASVAIDALEWQGPLVPLPVTAILLIVGVGLLDFSSSRGIWSVLQTPGGCRWCNSVDVEARFEQAFEERVPGLP